VFSAAWPFVRSAVRRKKGGATIIAAALAKNEVAGAKKLNTDYVGGAIILGVVCVFFLQIKEWSKYATMAPQSVLFILALFGLALLVKGKFKPEMIATTFTKISKTLALVIVVGLLWVFLLEKIGFLVTSFAAFFTIMFAFHPKKGMARILGSTAVAVGVIALLYLLFAKFLLVSLPTGILI
jgi:hypothetical protein